MSRLAHFFDCAWYCGSIWWILNSNSVTLTQPIFFFVACIYNINMIYKFKYVYIYIYYIYIYINMYTTDYLCKCSICNAHFSMLVHIWYSRGFVWWMNIHNWFTTQIRRIFSLGNNMALFHAVSNTNDVEINTPCKIMGNKVPRRN